jgi:hypothetical protein
MKKFYMVAAALIAVLMLCQASPLRCEEEEKPVPLGWDNELLAYLSLNQASFDNWSAGGENTLGWQTGIVGIFTNYAPRREWVNSMRLTYGMQKTGDQDARKSIDEIRLGSVYNYIARFHVDPYVAFKFESQFAKGYAYSDSDKVEISNFMDPGYFTESAGVGRKFFGDILRSRLGVAFKQTVTDKFPAPYADDPETEKIEKVRSEVGAEWVTGLDWPISENLRYISLVDVFSDMKASNAIDVRWDNLVAAKVASFITVSLDVRLFYDRDISTKRQLSQSLAIGFTYTLAEAKFKDDE